MGDLDNKGDNGVMDWRYVGPRSPVSIAGVMRDGFWWRCMNGKVYACHTGAGGKACAKPDLTMAPSASLRTYCAKFPNGTYIPEAANDTFVSWRCDGPTPVRETLPPLIVDRRGFVKDSWLYIPD